MSEYALIKNGTARNVIVADPDEAARQGQGYDAVIRVDDRPDRPGPGWTYDATAGTFAAPPAQKPPSSPPRPDRLASARAAWAASSALTRTDALTAIAIALGVADPG